jgi:hypothetical protein
LIDDLILSMADSENLKIFSLSTGFAPPLADGGGPSGSGFASPLADGGGPSGSSFASPLAAGLLGSGKERSSFTRVFRDLVRSKNGRGVLGGALLHISAHEVMKCHVEVPSTTAWLKAKPIASPSLSFVNCKKSRLQSSYKS